MNWEAKPITDKGLLALGAEKRPWRTVIHCWGEGIREVVISWQWVDSLQKKVIFVGSSAIIGFLSCETLGDVAELYRMLTGKELEYSIAA